MQIGKNVQSNKNQFYVYIYIHNMHIHLSMYICVYGYEFIRTCNTGTWLTEKYLNTYEMLAKSYLANRTFVSEMLLEVIKLYLIHGFLKIKGILKSLVHQNL